MTKRKKGEFGYLKYKKSVNLLITVVAFAIVFAILFAGILIFKSKANYMTVLSVVLVLPSAKFAVAYFILLPHQSCEESTMKEINEIIGHLSVNYDLVVSNSKKPIGTLVVVNSDNAVIAYTKELKSDVHTFEESVKTFLKNDKLNVNATLYTDYSSFKNRIKTINANYDSSNELLEVRKNAVCESMHRMSL